MRRRLLYSASNNGKPISNANYADICYYDANNDEFIIVDVADIEDYVDARYTPIGIVAVPSSHTDEGRPRIMSLVHMNCDTPKTGSTSPQSIYCGDYGTIVSGLDQKNDFPYMGGSNTSVTTNASVSFNTSYCYLPSDSKGENGLNNWDATNQSNSNEHFYSTSYNYYMCSPYKQDGSKDTRYFSTSNTGDYSSWTPSTSSQSDYPAASCCDMFSTVGTNQGDWYLPAAGELGYAIVRMQAIQNSMQALVTKGYTAGLLSTHYYWSSTQYSSDNAVRLGFPNGYVSHNSKRTFDYVRAFLAL